MGAHGGAHRRHAAGVVADAHLQLHALIPLLRRARGLLGGARAVGRAHGRVDLDLRGGVVGEQRRHRLARAPPGAIPQREVDRGERRG